MAAKISVITASYNYENYIKETIESVQKQTVSDWEMVIVDDGSKDNSVAVIQSYCDNDSRIKLYCHKDGANKGLVETLKLGLKKASGEWIVFLESDDSIEPNYIEEKLKIIEQYPEIKFIFNDVKLFGDEDRVNEMSNGYFRKLYKMLSKVSFPTNVVKMLKKRNIVPTFSCVMLNKAVLREIEFPTYGAKWTDYFLWSQIAYKYDFYYLDKKMTNRRMSKTSYISKKEDTE
jgi:glycosyltransferase involved in cell wall biosynthesis